MDLMLHSWLNRSLFNPAFIATRAETPAGSRYSSVPYAFTGTGDRFGALVRLFRNSDIVTFYGGFSPVVCEAAKASKTPALVEFIHTIEQGQVYDEIDLTICVSEAVRRAQPDKDRTIVIPNGVDLQKFPYRGGARDPDKIIILQVSNRKKPVVHLDALAAELLALDPRIELWLAGPGQDLRSADRVKYLGVVEDVASLYRGADIVFLFSDREAFGLVLAEAMASGSVPVAPDENGPSEIIDSGVDGFLAKANDEKSAVAAIREALGHFDGGKWEAVKRAAREKVERKYDIVRCIADYEKALITVAERKRTRTEPGPERCVPPPEVFVEEAASRCSAERWPEAVACLDAMSIAPAPLQNPMLAWTATKIALYAIGMKRPDVAAAIYWKLFRSGFRDSTWMKTLANIEPYGKERTMMLEELARLEPDDVEAVMLLVEDHIGNGRLKEAMGTLEKAMALGANSPSLANVHRLMKDKISSPEKDGR